MSHSSDNKRIYTSLENGVQYGVSVADVQAVLTTSANDIGSLCTTSNINKWAKYKPEETPDQGTVRHWRAITDTERADNNYGLTIASAIRVLQTLINNYATNYAYTPPSTVYRLSDFAKWDGTNGFTNNVGYKHNAKGFLTSCTITTNSASGTPDSNGRYPYYINYTGTGIVITANWYRTTDDEEIGLDDIPIGVEQDLADVYFGVIIAVSGATSGPHRMIIAESVIGSSTTSTLTIPDSVFTSYSGSNFIIYPIFSLGNENMTGEGQSISNTSWDLIALPTTAIPITIANAENAIRIGNGDVSLTSEIGISGGTTITVGNLDYYLDGDLNSYSPTLIITYYGGASEALLQQFFDNGEDYSTISDYSASRIGNPITVTSWNFTTTVQVASGESSSFPFLTKTDSSNQYDAVLVTIRTADNTPKFSKTATSSGNIIT